MVDDQFLGRALGAELTADQTRPADMRLDRGDGLFIKWADGQESHYPLGYLRKMCPCASCREQREKPPPSSTPVRSGGLSLTILPNNIDRATQFTGASVVGKYAIQITWADGHSTGIYDFRYLRYITPGAP